MATLRKRNGKWQVQVGRQGHSPVSKSFLNRKDAEAWAKDVERRLDQGEALPARQASDSRTLGDLLVTYGDKITPQKKSASVERYRIDKILRHSIANTPAAKLMPAQVASYRDERLESVSG